MAVANPGPLTPRGCSLTDNQWGSDTAKSWGYIPGVDMCFGPFAESHQQHWATRVYELLGSGSGAQGGVPVAVPHPWTTDGSGLAVESGTVMMVAGSSSRAWIVQTTIVGGGSLFTNVNTSFQTTMRRHHAPHVAIYGCPPGGSGTLSLVEYSNFQVKTTGSPTTIASVAIDGADGADQFIRLDDVVLPDNVIGGFYYLELSWSGDLPYSMILIHTPWYCVESWIVPTASVAGYTDLPVLPVQADSYDIGIQPGTWDGTAQAVRYGEHSYMNESMTRDFASANVDSTWTPNSFSTLAPRRCLALPSTMVDFSVSGSLATRNLDCSNTGVQIVSPGVWNGSDIQWANWLPFARGIRSQYVSLIMSGGGGAGSSGTDTSSLSSIIYGPGWRNMRIWLAEKTLLVSTTISSIILQYRIDGGAWVNIDLTSMTGGSGNVATPMDQAGPFDGTTIGSTLQYRFTVTYSTPTTGGYTVRVNVSVSPRVDIPSIYGAVGRGCDDVVPAYKAGSLSAPVKNGGVLHVAAGTLTTSWSVTVPVGSTQSRTISFVPATTGYYRIKLPSTSFGAALGERVHRRAAVYAHVCRAGRRFWGNFSTATTAYVDGTWELESVPTTTNVIPGSGFTLATSTMSPAASGQFFGSIALPSAGSYLVKMRGGSAPAGGWRMLGSLTDSFCSEPSEFDSRYYPSMPTRFSAVNALNTPPGSPTTSTRVLIGDTPTGDFVGHAGKLAAWNGYIWRFLDPARLGKPMVILLDGVYTHIDTGVATALSAFDACSFTVTVDAAATLYIRAMCADEDNQSIPYCQGSPIISWAAV